MILFYDASLIPIIGAIILVIVYVMKCKNRIVKYSLLSDDIMLKIDNIYKYKYCQ